MARALSLRGGEKVPAQLGGTIFAIYNGFCEQRARYSVAQQQPITHTNPSVLLVNAGSRRVGSIRRALAAYEYPLAHESDGLEGLVANCQAYAPEVIAIVVDEPNASAVRALAELAKSYPLPVVMFVEQGSPTIIQAAVSAGVHAFIVAEVESQRIPSILTVAIARFQAQQHLVDELASAKAKLEERQAVDRAKGLLIRTRQMSEEEAHRTLQKMAMDRGQTIATVALTVIDVLNLEAH